MEHIFLKKKLPPPYLLGYGVHWRLSLNGCLLDTANELDDGVRQTHVMGANRGDDIKSAVDFYVKIQVKT